MCFLTCPSYRKRKNLKSQITFSVYYSVISLRERLTPFTLLPFPFLCNDLPQTSDCLPPSVDLDLTFFLRQSFLVDSLSPLVVPMSRFFLSESPTRLLPFMTVLVSYIFSRLPSPVGPSWSIRYDFSDPYIYIYI